jgi:hypothetical protein
MLTHAQSILSEAVRRFCIRAALPRARALWGRGGQGGAEGASGRVISFET